MKTENIEQSGWRGSGYQNADIIGKLIISLCEIQHTMRQLYEGKGSQKRILILLKESGGSMTQRELTRRLGIQPGSVSEIIGKLEACGLVECGKYAQDRRTVNIMLTPSGTAASDEAAEQRIIRHNDMFSCLSDEEKNKLLAIIEKLNDDWEERYPQKHPRKE